VNEFATQLISWFNRFGRHDLPWQTDITPYRVWVSEIMLQQTQVVTVIPYFNRFMEKFPSVEVLAAAELDDVLVLWAGLGYYARARNLYRAANLITTNKNNSFPKTIEGLMALPGIGRSTAGAIVAIAYGKHAPILDGNVKRVLARYYAVEGWPEQTAVKKQLWELSEKSTPTNRVADYTQAVMDLGATVCMRARPRCDECPVNGSCVARKRDLQEFIPGRKPRKKRPRREIRMLLVEDSQQRILLEKRALKGIWGGLYSLPELPAREDPSLWCDRNLGVQADTQTVLKTLDHSFTHFDLSIHPLLVRVSNISCETLAQEGWLWYNPTEEIQVGVASPVAILLRSLLSTEEQKK
jgi:A/G-specific adenine glycosylase